MNAIQGRRRILLSTVLRLAVAGSFLVAGALKLKDPAAFAEQIANYQFLPALSNYLAAAIPSIELLASATLIFAKGPFRLASALTLFGLLTVFTTALLRAWALGIDLECGCFGVGSTAIGMWPVLRNLSLMTALGLSVLLQPA
jgi:putative oxidoreductase